MCIFSRAIDHVASTTIFARGLGGGRQALVYAMELAAAEDLAMVLPLPVPASAPDDAVQFVNLERYPALFADLKRAFPPLESSLRMQSLALPLPRGKTLRVHTVGAFEASFVPHPRDFARLDARFRLPPRVLDALPDYADWGFAVFQLRASRERAPVHPMALVFPRRDPAAVFFPTVHVHDGSVPAQAAFDHVLYAQLPPHLAALSGWTPSHGPLGETVDAARVGDLVDLAAPGIAIEVAGTLPNRDLWLREPAGVSASELAASGPQWAYRIRASAAFSLASHFRWRETMTTRLPALCAGLRRGLPELCARMSDAWQLGPLSDALPPHFMNGRLLMRGTSWEDGSDKLARGPARILFRPYTDDVETQEITLGFRTLPSHGDACEIDAALRALLDRAIAQ